MKRSITAVILAGGKNSRFKSEKSLIKINDRYIIKNQVELLYSVFNDLIIVSDKNDLIELFSDVTFIKDEFQNCGPLGGIHVALKKTISDAIFVFACDMPLLNKTLIKEQIDIFNNNHSVNAVIPSHSQGFEPLHSIYDKNCLPLIESQLIDNDYSIRRFYGKINKIWYHVSDDYIQNFFNINTQNDFQKLISKNLCNFL